MDAAAVPVPPLLRLSTELLDRILVLALPHNPRKARTLLSHLLPVHRSLVPLVRRHLYHKLTLIVGDPRQADTRLVRLLDDGVAGHLVRFLKVRAPNIDPAAQDRLQPGDDPALALVPVPRLAQDATVRLVAHALARMHAVRHLEFDLRAGAWLEDAPPASGTAEFGGDDALDALRRALSAWTDSLQTLIVAVEDTLQRQQVWASPALGRAPHVDALARWDRLTTLELWRVQLVLSDNEGEDFVAVPSPNFHLHTLSLTQCTLGGASELRWLLGPCGSPRSAHLRKLILAEVDFAHHPASSAPLLSVFPDEGPRPSFADTLECLVLELEHSVGSPAAPTPPHLLSPLSALDDVDLSGAGVDYPLISSLFRARNASSPSPARPPSAALSTLTLGYLAHPSLSPLSRLTSLLLPPSSTSSSSPAASPIPRLSALHLHESSHLPRQLPWSVRRTLAPPVWRALTGYDADAGPGRGGPDPLASEGWREVLGALRSVRRDRRRRARSNGAATAGGEVDGAPVRVWRNKLEVGRYWEDDEDDGEGEEAADGSFGSRERDDEDEDGVSSSSAAEEDPNGLFVPSEGASEGEERDREEWEGLVRRRDHEDDEGDSDF
ncbi:uncharacterized protein JCM10292_004949 [Rhodotorula paludigena]|uniref:uncharacterized protein n=1 Tax=Rhodotorula paludigena TaxID=86838 RepID=UPI003170BC91